MERVPKGTYSLPHSKRLNRTRADFYDTVMLAVRMTDPDLISAGKYLSPPSAGEEEAVYRKASPGAKKLRDVEEFRDHFANNDEGVYIWGHSSTGLRFREADLRKPYNVGDKITAQVIETDITPYLRDIADPKFTRDSWKDIIDKVNQVKGELAIPYCRGHVIREMHPIFGIFTEVEPTTEHKAPYALHAWLRENLDVSQDPISGHYDVAVVRGSGWRRGVGGGCLYVGAYYGRLGAS
ncbi:hypothetical protein HYZ41_03390 [archaeon]|nr:hypothetical protein [archaeon]